MGITRGAAFIITEGRYFDVSSKLLGGWRPLGMPLDWVAPLRDDRAGAASSRC